MFTVFWLDITCKNLNSISNHNKAIINLTKKLSSFKNIIPKRASNLNYCDKDSVTITVITCNQKLALSL